MKIQFDEDKISETIEHYEMKDNSIIVKYLDGTENSIPYTKINLEVFKNQMLQQAIERNDSDYVEELYLKKDILKRALFFIIPLDVLVMLNSAYSFINTESIKGKIIDAMFILFFALCIKSRICKCIEFNRKHKDAFDELDKYDEFLALRNDFEEYGITINDIDNYSLKEIIDIEDKMNENGKIKKLV